MFYGKPTDYVIRAISLMEHLEGTKTLERVLLEAEREKLRADMPIKAHRIREITKQLRELEA